MNNDYLDAEYEIDEVSGQLRKPFPQQNSLVQTGINRKLLYTKPEVDAKIAAIPSGGGQVNSVVAGTNVTVDNTDPANPIVSSTGGATSPLTTKGDVWVYGSADTRLPIGTNTKVLTADSSQTSGLKWEYQNYTELVFDTTLTASGNIINDWNNLNFMLALIKGKKRVTFTNRTVTGGLYNELMPSGISFNFDNTVFAGVGGNSSQGTGCLIAIADGATISSWTGARLEKGLGLGSLSTSVVWTVTDQTIELDGGSMLISLAILGAGAMISHTSGTLAIYLSNASYIYGASLAGYGGTCITQSGGSSFIFVGSTLSFLDNNVFAGAGGSLQRIVSDAGAFSIASNTQSGFSGTLTASDKYPISVNIKYPDNFGENGTTTNDVQGVLHKLRQRTPRLRTFTSSSAPTWSTDNTDLLVMTAISSNVNFSTNMSGTPYQGQIIEFLLKDAGTSKTLTYPTNFANFTGILPTATTVSTWHHFIVEYNSTDSKYYCIYSSIGNDEYRNGNTISKSTTASGANGNLKLSSDTDGGEFNLFSDANGTLAVYGSSSNTLNMRLIDGYLALNTSHTPSSASDTGEVGQIAWDSSYIYICTATNTWKRVAIATW